MNRLDPCLGTPSLPIGHNLLPHHCIAQTVIFQLWEILVRYTICPSCSARGDPISNVIARIDILIMLCGALPQSYPCTAFVHRPRKRFARTFARTQRGVRIFVTFAAVQNNNRNFASILLHQSASTVLTSPSTTNLHSTTLSKFAPSSRQNHCRKPHCIRPLLAPYRLSSVVPAPSQHDRSTSRARLLQRSLSRMSCPGHHIRILSITWVERRFRRFLRLSSLPPHHPRHPVQDMELRCGSIAGVHWRNGWIHWPSDDVEQPF